MPDKYDTLRIIINDIFEENRCCYGCRRIRKKLQQQGINVSEKLVRRIMRVESMVVFFTGKMKSQSYQGEISPKVENIISRDFHTNAPNKKWICGLKSGELPVIHTDRGCRYRWQGWIKRMKEAGLNRSMSKKRCSPDNSACEGFFGRQKMKCFMGKAGLASP